MIQKIDIKDVSVVEEIRKQMSVATKNNKGLMSTNELINVGNIQHNNLEDVGSAFGYAFGTEDGSGLTGPFLSLKNYTSAMQFKATYTGGTLKVRVYNQESTAWSSWKVISFT